MNSTDTKSGPVIQVKFDFKLLDFPQEYPFELLLVTFQLYFAQQLKLFPSSTEF